MTSRNIVYVDKEYSAGIHRFTTVGDGSNTASVPNLIGRSRVDVMTIRNSNIGIGTNNPLVSLDIRSKDAIQLPKGSNSDRPIEADGMIRFNTELGTFEGYSRNTWGAIGGGGEAYWSSNLDKNTLFYSSNNVGIGTYFAEYRLDVQGTMRSQDIITSNLDVVSLSGQAITDSVSIISSTIAASATAIKTAYDLAAAALPKSGGIVNGNIDILGHLFTSNLTVVGDYTTLNTVTSNTEQIVVENAGTGPALKVTQTGPQPVAEFYDRETGLALTIANNGNIGIGVSQPNYKLDVFGNVNIDGILTTNNSNIDVGSGTIVASIFQGTATQVSQTLVRGNYLSGNNYNGSASTTWDVIASTCNIGDTVVARDSTGYIYSGGVGIGTTIARQSFDMEGIAYFNGNVGIGSVQPTQRLVVDGIIQANGLIGSAITDSVSTINSTIAASATGLKTTYDIAAAAFPNIGGSINGNLFASNISTCNLDLYSKGALKMPSGSNSDRPAAVDGMIRYNEEQQIFEGYSKNIWGAIGGGGGGESYWSSNLDTNTLFYSSNNVGIATNQAFYTLDVNGTIRASNIILSGNTFIQEDSPAIRNRLQLRPLVIRQQISTLNPNTSNFSGYYEGFYKATAENTHVFVNSIKKIYRSSNERDYAVTYARDTLNNRTLFEVTLEETPSYGDLIDITIWPEYDDPTGILQPGYVLQNIAYSINVGNGTEGSMGQVQVNPYRTIYYTSNTQSIFDLTVPGIFGGGPIQTQVFIGQKLLSYYNSNVKDYDVSYMFGSNINGKYTTYTITLNQPATFGNVVDITVNPQLVQGSDPMFGYVYQSFSHFERYGSNLFYTLGNIGIGTTVARVSLDTNRTDAYRLPTGSNSERPEGVDGYIRYNQEQQTFEGYSKNTWGAIGGGGGGITDADNITTSNLTVLGNLNIGAASGILKNRLQVNPLRKVTYIETSTCNSFYLDTEGIFGGHASNVDVYIGLQRLLYYTSNITYYDVNYTNSIDRTYYTITLTQPAIFGDLVDITVWPQMIQASSNLPGYVYQQLIMTYFEKNNGLTSSSNDLYYTLGNLGIGTSNTEFAKLTVAGDILPSSCNVYDLGSSNYRWRDLYLSGNTIDLGGTRISRNNDTGGMKITSKVNDSPLDFTAQHINALGTLFASNITIAGNALIIGDNGNVGMGTALPTQKLDVRGNIYASGNIVCSNISVLGDFVRLNTITSNTEQMVVENAGTGPALKVTQSGANSVAEFYDSESGVALFVGNNGNIGIGTNAPLAKLDLIGNLNLTGNIYKNGDLFAGGDTMPIGIIVPFYGTTVSDVSWLICDGSTYNRSAYIELANFLGVLPSATTFQVPDLRDRFLKGKGASSTLKTTGGSTTQTLIEANMPSHTHTGTTVGGGQHNHTWSAGRQLQGTDDLNYTSALSKGDAGSADTATFTTTDAPNHTHAFTTNPAGSGTAFDIQPPYTVVNYIIKAYNNQYSTPTRTGDYWSKIGSNVFYQSGSVGIATNAPQQLLDVNGNALIRGNIGIGTNVPLTKLHIEGTTYINGDIGIGLKLPARTFHGVGEFSWTPSIANNNVAYFNIHDTTANNGSNYSVMWRGLSNSGTTQARLNNFTIDTSVLNVNGDIQSPSLTGAVMHFARSTAPTGWLKCNGATISRITYASLYTAIGTTFGVGDGSTTFKLPDLRGEFIRSWDDGRGIDATGGNRSFGTFQKGSIIPFNTPYNEGFTEALTASTTTDTSEGRVCVGLDPAVIADYSGTGKAYTSTGVTSSLAPFDWINTANYGGGVARPRNIALLACIKY